MRTRTLFRCFAVLTGLALLAACETGDEMTGGSPTYTSPDMMRGGSGQNFRGMQPGGPGQHLYTGGSLQSGAEKSSQPAAGEGMSHPIVPGP